MNSHEHAPTIRFDRIALLGELRRLPPEFVTAFAAAIAQRLVTGLRALPDADHDLLDRLEEHARSLEALWRDLRQSEPDGSVLTVLRDKTLALVPYEDDPGIAWIAEAQESGSAVTYAIESRLTADAEQASWASQATYDYLDGYVIRRDDLDIGRPSLTEEVLRDPIVQRELRREARDLRELREADSRPVAELIEQFRARSEAEGATLLLAES